MERRDYSWVWILTAAEELRAYADLAAMEKEIERDKLTGTATLYPINVPVIEWAVREGHYKPKGIGMKEAFILGFSSASQPHFHFEDGSIKTTESEEVLGRCRLATLEKVFCVKLDAKIFPSAIFDKQSEAKLWIVKLLVGSFRLLSDLSVVELNVRRS